MYLFCEIKINILFHNLIDMLEGNYLQTKTDCPIHRSQRESAGNVLINEN